MATLQLYRTHIAERGLRVSTIRHARKPIGLAHGHAGVQRPDRNTSELGTREEGIDAFARAQARATSPV